MFKWLSVRRNRLKALFYIVGGAAILLGAPALFAVAGAWIAGSAALRIFDRNEVRREQSADFTRNVRSAKVAKDSHLRRNGWRFRRFPVDMGVDNISENGRNALFTAAGISNLIRAERTRSLFGTTGKAEYEFDVKDKAAAERIKSYIKGYSLDASVEQSPSGYVVKSKDISVIDALANQAYPKSEKTVEREVRHVRQYAVSGAKSYEEAVEMLKDDKSAGTCLNSFVEVSDTVDGMKLSTRGGLPVDDKFFGGSINAQTFIVNEEEVMKTKGTVSVPANITSRNAVSAFISENFDTQTAGVVPEGLVRYSDGIPSGISRHLVMDAAGHRMTLRDARQIQTDGLKAYAVFSSMDKLVDFLNEGCIKEGTFLSIGSKVPEVGSDRFVVELELGDKRIADAVNYKDSFTIPASLQVLADELGIDGKSLEYSYLCAKVENEGSVSAVTSKDISGEDLSLGARINGAYYGDLVERLTANPNLSELDASQALQWAKDASQIKSVTINVDPVKKEMRITSVVGDENIRKTEVRELTDKELDSLVSRGAISKVEMKDLLIQMHPDYFKTYAKPDGTSVFADAMSDFLMGKKPVLTSAVSSPSSTKKVVLEPKAKPVRKPKGPKLG